MGKNAYSLLIAFVPQSSLILKVPTRTVNVKTFPSPSVTGPFQSFLHCHRPQSPRPPMWRVRQVAFWRPRGAARATQSCAQGRPREALLVTAALASKALRVACASAGPATAISPASQEVFGPRPVPPPTPGRSLSRGARGLQTPPMRYWLEPGGPGDVPPPHNSRSLTLGPGSRSANSSSSSRVGIARTLSLLRARPAGFGGRCRRAEEGRGWRPRRQRGGDRDSVNAEQTRRRRHPHSRPFKRRLRAVLPVRAGPRAGPA